MEPHMPTGLLHALLGLEAEDVTGFYAVTDIDEEA